MRAVDENKQIPAAKGVFTWPSDNPQLIGGKCRECGAIFFPRYLPFHKPNCQGQTEEVLLSRRGKLESFTIQHYASPPPFIKPEPFVPYAVGLISLQEGISVAGMLTGMKTDDIQIGMELELIIEKMAEDQDGNEYLTWKFRPVSKQPHE
ncbi:MAG TPA: OB-fold domain-containing protein [Syntrophales bacterium]|nr:OB-fold domain-containing protein [Syntrophales bacterium]